MNSNRGNRGNRGRTRGRGRGRKGGKRNVNNVKLGYIGRVVPLKFNYQPPRLENNIRYHEIWTTQLTLGNYYDRIIDMVNVYDPDETGVGRTGYGWEICSKLYNRYRVLKVKWDVQIVSQSKTICFCVVPVNGSLTFTDINFPSELPFSRTGMTQLGGPPFRDIRTRSIDTLTGVSFQQYMIDDQYEGEVQSPGTTPINTVQLHIFYYNPNTTTENVVTNLQLEYTVVWYDPINITPTTRIVQKTIEGTPILGEKTLSSETQKIDDEIEQLQNKLDELKLEKEQLHQNDTTEK